MRCPECDTFMVPIYVPHYGLSWLWDCPRCGAIYDWRTGEVTSPKKTVEA